MTLDPQVAALLAASAGVGLMMALAGVQKNALEWRRSRRYCVSCGRERGVCGCSSR